MPHGFTEEAWEDAKREACEALIAVARRRGMITYGELFGEHVRSISLAPNDYPVSAFLDQISTQEDEAGRGLLSVLVVHKHGDMEPGRGFYELAQRRGRDCSDRQRMWVAELHRVHGQWAD